MHTIDTIGIDLGTTNSVVAIWNAQTQQVEVLNNHEGEHLTPSVVLFDPQQPAPTVGQSARIQALQEPERVIYSVKRFIGRTFQDQWVRYDQEHVTYSIEETPQHKVIIKVGEQRLTPSQISAAVLRKLKQDAEAALGERPITRAIITVPAYFNDAQRQATKEAANLAGLEVLQLLSEPNAAALAFGLGTEPQTFAVFDLGGGTFDLSLLQLKRGGLFRVVGTKGDTHLGGDDIDLAIVQWLLATLERDHNITLPLASDPQLRARLRTIAEAAKIALTTAPTCTIDLSPVPGIDSQQPNLQVVLTQKQLADLLQPFIQKTLDICDQALAEARLTPDAIDQVLLVGGQTRTPFIKAALHQHYGWYVNDTVNPDEVVARGAAILAARYCGYLKDQVRLMDVIPLSLGIALNDGSMKRIIEANTHIPTRKPVKNFTTQRDGQEQIRFCVYQGERPIASDNVLIGEVILPLTLSRPAGAPHITCTFQVDRDGSLHVYAQDEDTDSEPVKKTFISILVSILNRNGGQEWG